MTNRKNPGLRARSMAVQAAAVAAEDKGEKMQQEPAAPENKAKPVGLTLRLDPARHDTLRRLAFEERVSIHALLLEGVDLVLRKRRGG